MGCDVMRRDVTSALVETSPRMSHQPCPLYLTALSTISKIICEAEVRYVKHSEIEKCFYTKLPATLQEDLRKEVLRYRHIKAKATGMVAMAAIRSALTTGRLSFSSILLDEEEKEGEST
jgi:hypothetical protein